MNSTPQTEVTQSSELLKEEVWSRLKQCFDPEIPLNIVDLGLIYGVEVKDGGCVTVKITLTSPGCHMGGQIAADIQDKILAIESAEEANVELVWDPPWHQSKISETGRKQLGLD